MKEAGYISCDPHVLFVLRARHKQLVGLSLIDSAYKGGVWEMPHSSLNDVSVERAVVTPLAARHLASGLRLSIIMWDNHSDGVQKAICSEVLPDRQQSRDLFFLG